MGEQPMYLDSPFGLQSLLALHAGAFEESEPFSFREARTMLKCLCV